MSANFSARLRKYYTLYGVGFVLFLLLLWVLEKNGLPRAWIGYLFLSATVLLYAGIGIVSRTTDLNEYYVAGRRVPALFNGMATAADWMSAASFIALAGVLYLQGFDALAFIMGWTGGYCLVAFFLAPYLRKFGQFTIPDFLGMRYGSHSYGGNSVRVVAVLCTVLCSFTYVVAQIYGVGLIVTRFTGLEFIYGVFVGLGGILVCSLLGGMRAVTWTQVAQYIVLIVAYLIPVLMLSVKHTGLPLPQWSYGSVLEKVTQREQVLNGSKDLLAAHEKELADKEKQVRDIYRQRAADARVRLENLPQSWQEGRAAAIKKVDDLKSEKAPAEHIEAAEAALALYPANAEDARRLWQTQLNANTARAAPLLPHAEPYFSANPDPVAAAAERNTKRLNFLALVFCLMLGTAALPHVLMRYYTTPSVQETRASVFWSLFFIVLLYFTAPALAVLAKFDVYTLIVGSKFADLPAWVTSWSQIDGGRLLNITDINNDGIVQLAEISIGADIIMLATPEIAGLPYVVTGLVAAGGLAAALSTADGLLLTLANAMSHDVYYQMLNRQASNAKRVGLAKVLLLLIAVAAAAVAARAPDTILFLVSAAFSLAAASFFPVLVLGVFWKRANQWGALLSMLAGAGVTFYYLAINQPWLRSVFGVTRPIELWFGIQPISAGVFGVPVAFAVLIVVSLLTRAPDAATQEFVEQVRYPNLKTQPPASN